MGLGIHDKRIRSAWIIERGEGLFGIGQGLFGGDNIQLRLVQAEGVIFQVVQGFLAGSEIGARLEDAGRDGIEPQACQHIAFFDLAARFDVDRLDDAVGSPGQGGQLPGAECAARLDARAKRDGRDRLERDTGLGIGLPGASAEQERRQEQEREYLQVFLHG